MKHTKTLSAVANAIVSWSNGITAANVERKALLERAAKLSLPEKQKIDAELVNYYALQAGVEVKEREKAHALFCGVVPAWEKNEKGQVAHPAAMALSRARGILYAHEKGEKTTTRGGATQGAPKVKPATVAQVLSFAEAQFARKEAGEKLSREEKSEIRKAAQMLLSLLAS